MFEQTKPSVIPTKAEGSSKQQNNIKSVRFLDYARNDLSRRLQAGFSLVELMIVISILGIVMAGAFTSYSGTQRNSRDSRRLTDMESIRQALELYRSDNGMYPSTGGGSWTDLSSLSGVLVPNYISKLPADPLTGSLPYRYQAANLSGGRYYGYCLEGIVENTINESITACAPENGYTYTVKNP